MRIYYKTASVLVTEDVIQVNGRPTRRITSLGRLYEVAPQWTDRRSGQAAVTALASVAVAVHDLASEAGPLLLVPALSFAATALGLIVGGRRDARAGIELWAVTRTGHVCLFRSRHRDAVAEVRRAVIDAREGRRL